MNISSHQQARNATSSNAKLPNLKKTCAIRKATRKLGASAMSADLMPAVRSNVYTIFLHSRLNSAAIGLEICAYPEAVLKTALMRFTLVQAVDRSNSRQARQLACAGTKALIWGIIHWSAHGPCLPKHARHDNAGTIECTALRRHGNLAGAIVVHIGPAADPSIEISAQRRVYL